MIVGFSGNALLNRVVSATPITLGNAAGRFMASQSVGGTSTLATSGADSQYTRVTVAGTLFNGPGVTGSYSLAPATYSVGPVSGSVVLTTTGEGLSGETPINVTVDYTGDALLNRVVTATPIVLGNAAGRFMASQSVGGTSTLATSGDDSQYTRVTVNGTLFNSATSTSTYNLAPATYSVGPVSSSVVLTTTGEGLSGETPINVTVDYAGDALLNRVVTATPIVLGNAAGRFMASQSVGGTSTLATSGADSQYTRVTVNGTLFNSATSTSTYNLASGTYSVGPVNGSVVLTTTGEGLSGETPINVTVDCTGDALLNRVVTATPITLGNAAGRFMASQSVGGTSTLATSGDDSQYTRVTVNGTLFNSATSTSTYNLASGTYSVGPVSGSVVLTTTGEGLSGETPINVTVDYAGDALLNRVVTATPIVLGNAAGRFMASQSVGGTSTLATSGDDSQYTRVTVNGTLFNSATSTSTYNLASGTYSVGPVSGSVVLTTTGEGLSGETPINVTVDYTGDALLNRVVTATPIVLGNAAGRFMASQSVGGTSTLATSGDDSQYTRVTVAGTLFNGPGVTGSYSLAPGTYAPGPVNGTITLPTSGEGLSGENPLNVTVGYTGDALLNRVVSATPITLGSAAGRFMAGQNVSGTSYALHQRRRFAIHPRHRGRHVVQRPWRDGQLQPGPGHLRPRSGQRHDHAADDRRRTERREPHQRDRGLHGQRVAGPRGDRHADYAGQCGGPLHGRPERERHELRSPPAAPTRSTPA